MKFVINSVSVSILVSLLCLQESCSDHFQDRREEIKILNKCGEDIYIFDTSGKEKMNIWEILSSSSMISEKVSKDSSYINYIRIYSEQFLEDLYDRKRTFNYLILKESTYKQYTLYEIKHKSIADTVYSLYFPELEDMGFTITYTGSD